LVLCSDLGLVLYNSSGIVYFKDGAPFLGMFLVNPGSLPGESISIKYGHTDYKARVFYRIKFFVCFSFIYERLVFAGFIIYVDGVYLPNSVSSLSYCSHRDILLFYSKLIQCLLKYYSCSFDRVLLSEVVDLLYGSCSLTLSKKYGCSLKVLFSRYSPSLTCPTTKISFVYPSIPKRVGISYDISSGSNFDLLCSYFLFPLDKAGFSFIRFFCCICCATSGVSMFPFSSLRKPVFWRASFFSSFGGGQVPLCSSCAASSCKKRLS